MAEKIEIDKDFGGCENTNQNVYMFYPDVFSDNRGSFVQTWQYKDGSSEWFQRNDWIKQTNVSYSKSMVIRGCHAQRGKYCQGKMVSAVNMPIFDIITDARPNSPTFKKTKLYYLNPKLQNRLWVPRGFLHAFMTLGKHTVGGNDDRYIFSYICDNVYNKESEITVNPLTIVPKAFLEYCDSTGVDFFGCGDIDIKSYISSGFNISEKDKQGMTACDFFALVEQEFKETGNVWYN